MARRNAGEGTIRFDRERKRWEARLTVGVVDGKLVRKKLTAKTKDQLLDRLKEARGAVDCGLAAPDRRETVGRFLDGWLEHLEHTERSPATVTNYSDIVKYLHRAAGRPVEAHGTRAAARREDATQHPRRPGKSARTAGLSRPYSALRSGTPNGTDSLPATPPRSPSR